MYIGSGIKAVLWDFDDTLVSTREVKWAAHRHVGRKFYGRELSDADLKLHWGKPLPVLCAELYGDTDPNRALGFLASCHEQFPKTRFAGTIPLLTAVRDSGRLTGLVTASSRWHLDHDLAALGIPHKLFDYTQTCDDTTEHKPNPKVFNSAIEWLLAAGATPSNSVYVGDSLSDWYAASGAGLLFVGVGTGLVTAAKWHSLGVVGVDSLDDLRFHPLDSTIV